MIYNNIYQKKIRPIFFIILRRGEAASKFMQMPWRTEKHTHAHSHTHVWVELNWNFIPEQEMSLSSLMWGNLYGLICQFIIKHTKDVQEKGLFLKTLECFYLLICVFLIKIQEINELLNYVRLSYPVIFSWKDLIFLHIR